MFKNPTLNVAPAAVMTAGTNGTAFAPKRAQRGVLNAIVTMLLTWETRIYQRQTLMDLDNRALKDMGISPADAAFEARKPFWIA